MKKSIQLLILFPLTFLSELSFSQEYNIQRDSPSVYFNSNENQVLWNSVGNDEFEDHIYFKFKKTNLDNFYIVTSIYGNTIVKNKNQSSAFNEINSQPIYLDLVNGELISDNKLLAYYCGHSKHYNSSRVDTNFRVKPLNYSKWCPSKTEGFVLNTESQLDIIYSSTESRFELLGKKESTLSTYDIEYQNKGYLDVAKDFYYEGFKEIYNAFK